MQVALIKISVTNQLSVANYLIVTILQVAIASRVESGSDDLDNLGHCGHFFGRSSGSHLQTKLSGCNPDITCSLENSVGIW